MPATFSETEFDETLALFVDQPWLKAKHNEYSALLKEFPSADQRHLIIELLKETIYLDQTQFLNSFDSLAQHIENEWQLANGATTFVSANSSGRNSSSHEALSHLRSATWTNPPSPQAFLNEFSAANARLQNGHNLVVVDDFIGSGETIVRAIAWFNKKAGDAEKNINIFVVCASACREGINNIGATGATIQVVHTIPKAISDRWTGQELEAAIQTMEAMESNLESRARKGALSKVKFGWGRQEAVFVRERGNTPNNVFPIFWLKSLLEGATRPTVMERR